MGKLRLVTNLSHLNECRINKKINSQLCSLTYISVEMWQQQRFHGEAKRPVSLTEVDIEVAHARCLSTTKNRQLSIHGSHAPL